MIAFTSEFNSMTQLQNVQTYLLEWLSSRSESFYSVFIEHEQCLSSRICLSVTISVSTFTVTFPAFLWMGFWLGRNWKKQHLGQQKKKRNDFRPKWNYRPDSAQSWSERSLWVPHGWGMRLHKLTEPSWLGEGWRCRRQEWGHLVSLALPLTWQ